MLAGFVAQDPYAKIIGAPLTSEPYGLGIAKTHPEFVRFVNAVLERMRADGTWKQMYAKWLKPTGAVPIRRPRSTGRPCERADDRSALPRWARRPCRRASSRSRRRRPTRREFLDALDRWVAALRTSLDELDAGAQLATDPDAYTSDITLAMSLCQSIDVATRRAGGRVGQRTRRRATSSRGSPC